jgi:acyl-CoA oxidase
MKIFRRVTKNPEKYASQIDTNPTIAYILQYFNEPNQKCKVTTPLDFNNQEFQLKAFGHRIAYLIANAVDQIDNQKKSWNSMLVEINRISKAHCQYLLVQNFITALQHNSYKDESLNILHNSTSLKKVMTSLCNLFVLHTMEKDLGEFFESEYLTSSQAKLLRIQIYNLLNEIRPNAVSLVDAFLIPDALLSSALGRYDGKVYETMIDWASKEPLNGIKLNINRNSNDTIIEKAKL